MLVVTWEQKDGISIATLAGRIDARNADEFQNMIESGVDSGAHAVILDFEQVAYISIAGLQTGLYIAQNLNKRGKQFAICTLSEQVGDIVEFSGFDERVPVYESQAAAINAFEQKAVHQGQHETKREGLRGSAEAVVQLFRGTRSAPGTVQQG